MSIAVAGVSFRTAALEVRERFALTGAQSADLADRLRAAGAAEVVPLATCNRTEIYVAGEEPGVAATRALIERAGAPASGEPAWLYRHVEHGAARHLFRVASGLDSLIVGEAQIQGQVRDALERAAEARWIGPVLSRLFQSALSVGGRVRSETRLSEGAGSVPAAAVELARKIFGSLDGRRAVVIGAGKMSELALRCLTDEGVRGAVVASRTRAKAEGVVCRYGAEAGEYERLPELLVDADIVISATSAPHPVLRAPAVAAALTWRKDPLLLLDIAFPRDIDPAVRDVDGAFLYDLDDLQRVVAGTLEKRRGEAVRATAIIEEATGEFLAWQRARAVTPLIRELRERVEALRRSELERTLRSIAPLNEHDRGELERLTKQLIAKLLHEPTVRLREAAASGSPETIEAARWLLALGEEAVGRSRESAA